MTTENLDMLQRIIDDSDNIVFFGGAGVSTESGIPDFRSVDGIYNMRYKYPPETILSHEFFYKRTEEFFSFYREKIIFSNAESNAAHMKLAEMEKKGKLKAVVTQNIDGLHQKGGSGIVLELHGSVYKNFCIKCHKFYGLEAITGSKGIPLCDCGGIIKPDVVLYGEMLDEDVICRAVEYIDNADVLIIGGTSLGVYPAAGLTAGYRGNKLILINRSETPMDKRANLTIKESIGKVLGALRIN